MKKILIFALIAFAGWSYFQKNHKSEQTESLNDSEAFEQQPHQVNQTTEHFVCDGRQHCSQMHSRAEAEYFLRNCPDTKMDGDHDGIPCENDSRF